jgi:hypothetical protein
VNGERVVVVVVDVVEVVEVVDVVTQPPGPHASQQLLRVPTQPRTWRHRSALGWTLQREPPGVTRQQVTAPGRPQVARRTQRMTEARHAFGSSSSSIRPCTTACAQSRYALRLAAVAQGQVVSMAARAVATPAASPHDP